MLDLQYCNSQILAFDNLCHSQVVAESELYSAQQEMDKILYQQEMLKRTQLAIQQAKPLLSNTSIKQCEELANAAIHSVFNLPYTIQYDPESQSFMLNKGNYMTDLATSEGGGLATLVSLVFDIFLLIKSGCRRFMVFDEAFYAVSEAYFQNFIDFLHQICKDLQVDILCISHDVRIDLKDVDRAYLLESGHSKRIK